MNETSNKQSSIPILLVVFSLALSTLACVVGQDNRGVLPVGEIETFVLLGEVDHQWEINVVSGEEYEVVVSVVDSLHRTDQLAIVVRDNDFNEIATEFVSSGENATAHFVAPDNGSVFVTILTKVGLSGETFGEHEMAIYEVTNE